MGKIVEKIKLTNFVTGKSVQVDALIDTGATMISLPQDTVDQLGLAKTGELTVRYGNNKTEIKSVYGVVTVEITGRTAQFDVLAEVEGSQPLVGQLVLERLDLLPDPTARRLIPNPRSPDMPMVDVLRAAAGGA